MTISKKDYVLASIMDKNYLVKVTNLKDTSIKGEIATVASEKVEEITFFPEDVIANLGNSPKSGTVYGIKVEIFNRYIDTKFGKVALFVKADKETKKLLIKSFNKAYSKLHDLGLLGFSYTLDINVKDKQGKMQGCYTASKNLDHNDTMTLFAEADLAGLTFEEVILHESGHGIWHRLIQQEKTKAKWVEDYSRYIEIQSVKEKVIKQHLLALINSGVTLSQYKNSLKAEGDEFDILLITAIIKYFKEVHRLSIKDLDYVSVHDQDFLKAIWPTCSQQISRVKGNNISDYSMKNVQEYFCECFRVHASGTKIPKTTRKLMEKTISQCGSVKGLN